MKNIPFIFLFILFLTSCGSASKINRADQKWSYEMESAGVGVDGTYAVKIWSYSRKPNISTDIQKINAIHGVIFKGIPAGKGSVAQPPLANSRDIEQNNINFFNNFFVSDYPMFINGVIDGSTQVIKTGKKEYKIGVIVSVSKDKLREFLENNGVIKSLSDGF